jgi:hypothetical protein
MWTLLLLASAAAPSPICQKLDAEFHSSEKFWGFFSRTKREVYNAAVVMAKATGDFRDNYRARVDLQDLEQFDRAQAEKADRILTIMLANKCTPPEHVASPFNHQGTDQSSE